jgi:hypothetical protein
MRKVMHILVFMLLVMMIAGCDLIDEIAPPPPATQVPTEKVDAPTETPRPTLGDREFIDAVYCWESHIDEGEYNLIRFFPSGKLINVFVQPYSDCLTAWEESKDYLTEDKLMIYNHGDYYLSGDWIEFTLSPPNSDEIAGEITGRYEGAAMHLLRQGAEEREYILLTPGE